MENNKGRNLIFLISQPRAGSTMLQRILGNHPDIHTTSESWIMLHPIYALKQSGIETEYSSDLSLQASSDFISQLPGGMTEYNNRLSQCYSQMYQRIIEASGKSLYLDKTPRYYFIIKELHDLYPEAKFIILLRNPLSVLASIISTWTKHDWYLLSNYKSDLIDAPGHLIDGLELLKSSCISLSYETFLANPEKSLQKLNKFLNVKYLPEIINYGNFSHRKWKYGDQHTVNKRSQPDVSHADKWKDILNNPQTWRIMNEYLEIIGKDHFEKMGYEYDLCKTTLDEKKPAVAIEKHSIGFLELLDNTHSFLIVNKQSRQQIEHLRQQIKLLTQEKEQKNLQSAELLNEYIKLRWNKIKRDLSTNKVAVYGTLDYCLWLHGLTKSLSDLDPVAVIIDHDQDCFKLWGKTALSPEKLIRTDVDAIVLATECYQKDYTDQCCKLYGKEIRLIDLYENIPSRGSYQK
jgi:hypothetical protein